MYTKILVPLDGSELDNVVLPYVQWFNSVSKVNEIVFLRVVEPFHLAGGIESHIQSEDKEHLDRDAAALAKKDLDKIAARFKDGGVKIVREVLVGKPGKTVVEYIGENEVDLVIMATHGYSGVQHWVRGSVAEDIISAAQAPVFLVTPRDIPPEKPGSQQA